MYGPRGCGKTHYLADRVKEIPEKYSVCFVSFIDKMARRIHKDNGFGKNVLSLGCRSFDRHSRGHSFDYLFWDDFDFIRNPFNAIYNPNYPFDPVHNPFNSSRIFEIINTRVARQLMVSINCEHELLGSDGSWEFRRVPDWHPPRDTYWTAGVTGTQGVTGSQGYMQGVTGFRGYMGVQGVTGSRGYTGVQGYTGGER
jgi:hypothetical protein